ncbi:unnamed protein product, partial [Ilex paraguariensis]
MMEELQKKSGGGPVEIDESSRRELLSPESQFFSPTADLLPPESEMLPPASWRLNINEFRLPDRRSYDQSFSLRRLIRTRNVEGFFEVSYLGWSGVWTLCGNFENGHIPGKNAPLYRK